MKTRVTVLVFCSVFAVALLAACAVPPAPVQTPSQDVTALQAQVDELQAKLAAMESSQQTLQQQNHLLKQLAGPPPASLAQYFPPQAPAPVFLLEMFALSGPFEGMAADLQQQDIAGVQANYDAFKTQYAKVAAMVPEWTDQFPNEPVASLGEALASGDPSQIGPAFGQVGAVCGGCHLVNQIKVMQQYHWPDFDAVEATNPLSGEAIEFEDYMFAMSGAFGAISSDLQQGQLEAARQDYQAFQALFSNLPEVCKACHETERTYFVDPSMQGVVAQLGEALQADAPDPQQIGELSGAIGGGACMGCHLVHMPAANAKARWETFADAFEN